MRGYRAVAAVLALALSSLSGSAVAVTWTDGNSTHEYRLIELASVSWPDAAEWITMNLGSEWYLATITSAPEQAFFTQNVVAGRVGEYWIGGYQDPPQSPPSANWHWVTGEPWVYTNWWISEPNDNYGPGSESYLGANFVDCCWNDEGDLDQIVGFVAERTAMTEPGTLALLGLGLVGLRLSRRRLAA